MWLYRRHHPPGPCGFFRLAQSHDTLPNFYTTNFNLKQHHGWTITEIESMLPFEREVYMILLKQWLDEQRKKEEQRTRHAG